MVNECNDFDEVAEETVNGGANKAPWIMLSIIPTEAEARESRLRSTSNNIPSIVQCC